MTRAILAASLMTLIALGTAGAVDKKAAANTDAMMAEMMNCAVCKHMVAHMDELMPVMSCEVISLDDGVAIAHSSSDPEKVALLQTTSAEMGEACAATLKMSDEEAASALCSLCNQFRGLMASGAHISKGTTKSGDIMIVTSDDAEMQAKIAAVGKTFEMALASH